MPLVKISLLNHWSDTRIQQLNSAIHNGLNGAIQIEDWDFFHRVEKYENSNFLFPSSKSQDFMIIELHLFPGRTDEQKRKIYFHICENLKAIGINEKECLHSDFRTAKHKLGNCREG